MSSTRNAARLVALVASVGLLATACSGGDDAGSDGADGGSTTDVKFGYIGDFNGASLLAVAEDQGYWKENGISADTSVFTDGPTQIQALGAGDLDFGYIGPGAMWLPASGKAQVVAINTLGNADRVFAQPGITSLADLKGKKVAAPEGTSGDMILTLALQSVGLTKDDVDFVPMDPATIVSAFGSGQIDAAGLWYPMLGNIKKQVPDLVELAKNEDFADTVSFPTAFVAGNDTVKDDPDTVEAVVAALKEATDYRAEHPEETVALTAKMLKADEADVEADAANSKTMSSQELDSLTEDGTVGTWLDGMNDYFVEAGKITEKKDPTTFYTGDLYTEAGK
ncbi:aliphatic sulfonate ABC transporter substrate-binding protein [Cellulomonas sp. PhB143]|uniref:aliphatic sulfonate ABC transporter substrate-binding protein n=1 Tax=Cellulomonas sp. PhB143 TaxID=2485186 RepID=UPI000F496A2B|nr:aliphatic sulfonate ABC transporter substrate-binding protein [Cellulomonas sp. PhB143]ROS75397.1 NitT/TauT family transport system substrate-binding protein [Cellulomonas sp. PhB143]